MIEQAIFTSCRGREADGYQLAAISAGVTAEEARELSRWGPAHNAFGTADSAAAPSPVSVNFHRLESGRNCLSCTRAAGEEYSGRRGARIYTQIFLAEDSTLARFASHPWRLWEALQGAGAVRVHDPIPAQLPPLALVGGSRAVDRWQLHRAVQRLGITRLVELLDRLLAGESLALYGVEVRLAVEGLLNLLPPEARVQVSFTTGLAWSASRPFRLLAAPAEPGARRVFERTSGLPTLDCADPASPYAPTQLWSREVAGLLRAGDEAALLRRVARDTELPREAVLLGS